MFRFLVVLSGSLLAIPTTASANAPAWCASATKPSGYNVVDAINDDEPRALIELVGALCFPDQEATQRRRELDASVKKWSKRLDLVESDWADVAQWAAMPAAHRVATEFAVDDKGTRDGYGPIRRAWSSLGAIDQYAAIKSGMFADNGNKHDYTYLADALKLTETGRLAYVEMCLDSSEVVEWAICQADIDALDRKKVVTEVRADRGYTGYERMLIRFGLFTLDKRLVERAKAVANAKQRDQAYAKMFDLAAAARRDWAAKATANAQLLDLVAHMDDARATSSRKAFDGCQAKTWDAFKSAVGAIPAKEFEGISTSDGTFEYLTNAIGIIGNSPAGYNAAIALYMCHASKPDLLVNTIGGALQRWPGYRGPRSAAFTAILNAGLELDDTSAKISYPSLVRHWLHGSSSGGNFGTIVAVKKQGDTAKIEFAKKLEKQEQCAASRTTNRIVQITASGNIIYQSICTKYRTVVVDKAPDAGIVAARYAEALKPGMNVLLGEVVLAAWNKGQKAPAVVAGVAVKQ